MLSKKEYTDLGFTINEKGYTDVLRTDLHELIDCYDDKIKEMELEVKLKQLQIKSLKADMASHHSRILMAAKELCEKGLSNCDSSKNQWADHYRERYEQRLKTIQRYAEKYNINLNEQTE